MINASLHGLEPMQTASIMKARWVSAYSPSLVGLVERTGHGLSGGEVGERYLFRPPVGTPAERGAKPPRYRRESEPGVIIERDVAVPVRGGVTIYADVFRPADEQPAPPLIAWSPYGKHIEGQLTARYPDCGVAPGQLSRYTAFGERLAPGPVRSA